MQSGMFLRLLEMHASFRFIWLGERAPSLFFIVIIIVVIVMHSEPIPFSLCALVLQHHLSDKIFNRNHPRLPEKGGSVSLCIRRWITILLLDHLLNPNFFLLLTIPSDLHNIIILFAPAIICLIEEISVIARPSRLQISPSPLVLHLLLLSLCHLDEVFVNHRVRNTLVRQMILLIM